MKLPNFLIVGAMKSGTTVLYQYLKQHPQIYMSSVKETNFFLRDHKNLEEYSAFFQGVSNEKAIGEASPCYLDHSKAYKRIAHYLPEAKLIAILRNPADRAYSHFFMRYRQKLHGMNEDEVLDYFTSMLQEDRIITKRGFYYNHLKNYFNLFERDRLKICLYEDLKIAPDALIQDIFQFLGVDEKYQIGNYNIYYNKGGIPKNQLLYSSLSNLRQYFNMFFKGFLPEEINKRIHNIYNSIRNSNLVKQPKLKPEIRQQLIKVYQEDILHLQDLIERDLSTWLK